MNEFIFQARFYEGKFAGLFNSVYTKELIMGEKFKKQALQVFSYGEYILGSKSGLLEFKTTDWNYGG